MSDDKVKGIMVTPIEAIVEPYIQRLTSIVGDAHAQTVKHLMLDACKRVCRHVALDFSRAATKGINQAVETALDPAYYEHRKQRIRKRKEYRKTQAKIDSAIVHSGSRSVN